MAKKRIAVIGAGASGLTAIKCCLDGNLIPVCFERTDHIGGLWHYTPDAHEGQSCVMKTTVINTCKEMMAYSDFPIPQDYPNFMHNTKVLEYFQMYLDHFKLEDYIQYKTEILSVKKASDFSQTGKWDLQVKDLKTSKVTAKTFDSVLVCTGHHAEKHLPHFLGQEDFQGKTVHTHDYKDHVGYENKRVVVVGIGNSGGDVAVELGRVCKQVYLSTRRGSWVINRVAERGMPADFINSRRILWALKNILPYNWITSFAEHKMNNKFDHAVYGLQPKHRLLSQHPMVNDDLPNRIICGSVAIKSNIRKITRTGVEFEDGTTEDNIDCIIFATGYKFGFPFIADNIIDVQDNQVNLYKYVYPPDLEHPTLAVIGCIQPWGAIMPISEMQCRWAVQLWNGHVKLPSRIEMMREIKSKQEEMADRYVKSPRHTIQVDYVPYMDELAQKVGCIPDIKKLLLTDPVLGWKVVTGPCTPYQYRLHGPNPWPEAREAIMTQWDRVLSALRTRKSDYKPAPTSNVLRIIAFVVLAIIISWIFF